MEADFGVLPPPKYDEAQDRYYSIIIDPFMQMIPITAKNAERTGNILDVLAAASHDTVVDAYVNVTLSGKVARDADTVRMLRLVFDDLSYSITSQRCRPVLPLLQIWAPLKKISSPHSKQRARSQTRCLKK